MRENDEPSDLTSGSLRQPQVGVFWGLPGRQGTRVLVLASVPVNDAEPYGDSLGFPQSYLEVWTAWRRGGATALARQGLPTAIANHEYEHFPRGRIVYMTGDGVFTVYADRKLQTPELLAEIVRRFGLGQQSVVVRSDAHYSAGAS